MAARGSSRVRFAAALVFGLVAWLLPFDAAAADGSSDDADRVVGWAASDVALLGEEIEERSVPVLSAPAALSSPSASRAESVPVREVAEMRDERTRVFENEDGSLTVDGYLTPIHFESDEGWTPIENRLREGGSAQSRFVTSGNDWQAVFGDADVGVELRSGGGSVTAVPLPGSEESGAAGSKPGKGAEGSGAYDQGGPGGSVPPVQPELVEDASRPAGSQGAGDAMSAAEQLAESAVPDPVGVSYDGVWRGADLEFEVRSDGLKEEIVVESASRGSRFEFLIAGASLVLREDGSVGLGGPVGERFEIPPPRVVAGDGVDLTGPSGVRYELGETSEDGQLFAVEVDRAWLESLSDELFPVRIDPTFTLVLATGAETFAAPGDCCAYSGLPVAMGRYAPNDWVMRSAVGLLAKSYGYGTIVGTSYQVGRFIAC